jgi:hypothetical protein
MYMMMMTGGAKASKSKSARFMIIFYKFVLK